MKHIILHLFPGTKLQIIFFNDSLFYTFTLINLKKMRNLIVCLLFLLPLTSSGQTAFDEYFTDKTLRFDFMLAGNSSETKVFPASLQGGTVLGRITHQTHRSVRLRQLQV